MNVSGSNSRVERFRFLSFNEKGKPVDVPAHTPTTTETTELSMVDALASVAPEDAPPPPPSFSEQQLEQAKQEAFQQGVVAGRNEAETARNKAAEEQAAAVKSLLQMISNRITIASEEHTRFLKQQHELLLNLSMAVARKVAGDALKREPQTSVQALLKECMGLFAGNERITVFVPTQRYEGLKQAVDTIIPQLKDFQGQLEIQGEDALAENDCRVEWKSGMAEYNAELLWTEIENIVKKTPLSS